MLTRLPKIMLAWALSLLIVSGGSLPSGWLWTCRHASQVVAMPLAAKADAMPCGMTMAAMRGHMMPCCRAHALRQATERNSPLPMATVPSCDPEYIPPAALAPANTEQSNRWAVFTQTATIATLPAMPPYHRAVLSAPLQQRPPPDPRACRLAFLTSPALRAPPVA